MRTTDVAGQAGMVAAGTPVGGLRLETLDGETMSLASLQGRVVVLDVFATWCVPCLASIPRLQRLQQRYGARGLQVVGLNVDLQGLEMVEPFCEELGIEYPVLLAPPAVIEGSEGPLGPLKALPMVIVVGRDGRVRKVLVGPEAHRELEEIVESLL